MRANAVHYNIPLLDRKAILIILRLPGKPYTKQSSVKCLYYQLKKSSTTMVIRQTYILFTLKKNSNNLRRLVFILNYLVYIRLF